MDVTIIGTGLYPFGRHEISGIAMGVQAARSALQEANLNWKDIPFVYGGSFTTPNPDTIVANLGLSGCTFINVRNGCATAGSALLSAAQAIESGQCDIAMAIGFDKHPRGAFGIDSTEWNLGAWYAESGMASTAQFFAMKIQRYMHDYGITEDTLIRAAERAYYNASLNPTAWRRQPFTYTEIAESDMIMNPLRRYMFCGPDEGAAAAILCKASSASRYTSKPVYLKAVSIKSRSFGSFEALSPSVVWENTPSPTVFASNTAYEMAGLGPEDIDVIQIQDTDSGSEVIHLAENGFCEHGEQEQLIRAGETNINGRFPINTDGGLLGNGEPVGASGLRQVHEICTQLHQNAGARQVPNNPLTGYTHVYGVPGISAVTILQR